jgi:uncharacterized protein (TIRG00374 family)
LQRTFRALAERRDVNTGSEMIDIRRIGTVVVKHQGLIGLLVVAIGATVFVVSKHATLLEMSSAVRSANLWWMIAAVSAELFAVWLVATKHRVIFDRLGHRLSGPFHVRLQLEKTAIGTISPIGGAPAYYVYARGLQRRGVPIDDILLAVSLNGVAGIVPLLVTVIFATLHFSSPTILLGMLACLGLVAILAGIGAIAVGRFHLLQRCFAHMPNQTNHFFKRARSHEIHLRDLALPTALALLGRLAGIATLYLCLRAVGQEPSLMTPIVVTVVGTLASKLMPIFRGLGVVEAAMAGSLVHVGIPAAPALGATLLYRLASLWLPLILGLLVQLTAASMVWARRAKTGPEVAATPARSARRATARRSVS